MIKKLLFMLVTTVSVATLLGSIEERIANSLEKINQVKNNIALDKLDVPTDCCGAPGHYCVSDCDED